MSLNHPSSPMHANRPSSESSSCKDNNYGNRDNNHSVKDGNKDHNHGTKDQVQFYDIAFNLTDDMYKGVYNGTSPKHPQDHAIVLNRALQHGVKKLMLTSVNYDSCLESLAYIKRFGKSTEYSHSGDNGHGTSQNDLSGGTCDDSDTTKQNHQEMNSFQTEQRIFCTIGVHPTHCKEFLKDQENEEIDENYAQAHLDALHKLAIQGKADGYVVAIGETGLDYLRTEFCPKHIQQHFFEKQLELGRKVDLPYFLHNRESTADLYNILQKYQDVVKKNGAVVHSFDGTLDELKLLCTIDNLYIGVNGCSFRTEENLQVVNEIPLQRLMLETDAPWCEVRPSHKGAKYIKTNFQKLNKKEKYTLDCGMMIKGRNEPCTMIQVAEIVAGVKGIPVEVVTKHAYENACNIFKSFA